MKSVQDKFSNQAKIYKKYRPSYPNEIYQDLVQLVKTKQTCWDCGTGNGQVAIQLAKHFKTVYATDISQKQLDNAEQADNIIYSLERAERTSFADEQFDLITVAQAIHWFDFEAFHKEVKRVGKNGAIISIWGYGLLRIDAMIDPFIDKFYFDIIGPYWNKERKHIDKAYESIPFEFKEIPMPKAPSIRSNWTVDQLEGYFNSWSSVQNFKQANPDTNPVDQIMLKIRQHWKATEVREVKFPIFRRTGEIEK